MSEDKSREFRRGNVVYIGRQKPVMNYVLATLTCLSNSPNVFLKARGAAITVAVNVAQITMHRFSSAIRVAHIKLDTEEVESQEGGLRNVSTIEIELTSSPGKQENSGSNALRIVDAGQV